MQELTSPGGKVIHRESREGAEQAFHQGRHIAVIAAIMFCDGIAQPGIIFFDSRFPGLLFAQGGILLRHFHPAPQDEIELDVHWFFAPQGAVVIEYGNALGRRHKIRVVLCGHSADKVDNGAFRSAIVPGGKLICHKVTSSTVRCRLPREVTCTGSNISKVLKEPVMHTFLFNYCGRTIQRKPICPVEVSTISAWRAAGR
jgi:hypothetical protein